MTKFYIRTNFKSKLLFSRSYIGGYPLFKKGFKSIPNLKPHFYRKLKTELNNKNLLLTLTRREVFG